ncbi:MAG: hypothetical protein NTW78_12955 [Campylobacterales bacterium]|nr:hypothetical protein [Campylobacterales bacterium]
MKKLLIILALIYINLLAYPLDENLPYYNGSRFYIGTDYGVTNSMDDGYFGGKESVGNVVGGKSSTRSDIEIGMIESSIYRPMNAFLYRWQYDSNKNFESGYGIGAKFGFRLDDRKNLGYVYFGAKDGIGSQSTKGNVFMTKNGLTNVSYATLSNGVGPKPAVFIKDTDVIEIDLLLGYTYDVCKTFKISANVDYISSNYDFAYHLQSGNVFLGGLTQDTLYFNVGVKYVF